MILLRNGRALAHLNLSVITINDIVDLLQAGYTIEAKRQAVAPVDGADFPVLNQRSNANDTTACNR